MLNADETAVIDVLGEEAPSMLARTESWAAISSGSSNLRGLALMAEALAHAFAPLGEPELVPAQPSEAVGADGTVRGVKHGAHVRLCVRPEAPVRVLLTGHMDTVYGADHPFKFCRREGHGRLNGPGVADMKGGLSVMLAALGAIERTSAAERLGYEVLIGSDEEVGSPSSAPLLAEAAGRAQWGLTYEPSTTPQGAFATPRWGSGNFAAVVAGRSAHAGRNPEDGRNALLAAADLALRLEALTGPDCRVNPARIDGGGPNNVVPATAILRFNIRPRSAAAQAAAQSALVRTVGEVEARREVAITLHGRFARPPKPHDAVQDRLFALVREASADLRLPYETRESGGVCDGNNLAAHGLPVVDTLGVRGGAIHSPAEFLLTESLVERARLSALLLLRLAR
ncbi:MAG: hydrolase [Sphingomonadaceae bacterium]|nr:hydrolase [Sphingomonadaceae bacterium]